MGPVRLSGVNLNYVDFFDYDTGIFDGEAMDPRIIVD